MVCVCSSDISDILPRREHGQGESAGLRKDLHFRIHSAAEHLSLHQDISKACQAKARLLFVSMVAITIELYVMSGGSWGSRL